jgi:poly(A) polymerase
MSPVHPPVPDAAWQLPATTGWLRLPATQAVFDAIEAAGHEVRAVGGAVRNTLLGRPVKDVDLATTARPEQVMAAAAKAGLAVIATGLQHGTVTVVSGHLPHEVTTLRSDTTTDGRHATVAFTDDWAADASRRDLTINALYCDRHGRIFDPLGGRADLDAGRVRFIGDAGARIREDYLRSLRFFRFHAEYAAGPPDPAGIAAIISERSGLARLSGERIHQELQRLLLAPGMLATVGTMADAGLLTELLPVVPRLAALERLVAIETAHALAPAVTLRLAALFVGVTEDAVRLTARLKLSTAERDILLRAGSSCGVPFSIALAALQRRLYSNGPSVYTADVLLAWSRHAAVAQPSNNSAWTAALMLPSHWSVPKLPFGGTDVLALGVLPGPKVGLVLQRFESWWLDNGCPLDAVRNARKLAEITHVN